MKKEIYLAIIFLILANGIQADMLVSAKDSTTVDSTEVVTLQFSDAEIMRIIEDSKSLNPHIEDMNIVQPGETVNYLIHDSIYSVKIPQGSSCWKVLSKGIKKIEIKPIKASSESLFESSFLDSENKKIILDSIFLIRVDSILENRNNSLEDASSSLNLFSGEMLVVDSNLKEKELAKIDSPAKNSSALPKRIKKNILPEKSMSLKDSLEREVSKVVDSMKVKDSAFSDTESNHDMSEDRGEVPEEKTGNNIFWWIIGIAIALLVMYLAEKKKKPDYFDRYYYSDEKNPDWDKKNKEDP